MRCVQNPQMALGQIPIADIQFDASSRDDIPAVLRGLQHLYCDDELLQRPRTDADQDAVPTARINPDVGRPGLQLWQVVVLAVLKQGLNCDCDRLAELASKHLDVRRMLGLPEGFAERRFTQRTVARNVGLLGPQLLAGINQLVVQAGLRVAGPAGAAAGQAVPAGDAETGAAGADDGGGAGRGRRGGGGAGGDRALDSLYGAAITAAWKEGVRRRGEPSPQVEGVNGGNRESGRFRRIFAVQQRARFIFLPGFRARPEAFGS